MLKWVRQEHSCKNRRASCGLLGTMRLLSVWSGIATEKGGESVWQPIPQAEMDIETVR